MNPNWPRWIFASASKAFTERLSPLKVYLEGQMRQEQKSEQYCEFRMDGPFTTETTKNNFELQIEINILIVSFKNDFNYHNYWSVKGQVASAFTEIPVYRYGKGTVDTQDLLGCLIIKEADRADKSIRILEFGQIKNDLQIMQSTVEATYFMTLRDVQQNGSN